MFLPQIQEKMKYLFLLIFFLGALVVEAQQDDKEILELQIEAKHLFDRRKYPEALEIYLHLDSADHSPQYYYPIAVCFLSQNDWRALAYFEMCMENPEQYPADLKFFTAQAHHLAHHFDEAIALYEEYKAHFNPNKKKEAEFVKMIDEMIETSRYAKKLVEEAPDMEIHNFGPKVNSEYPDYGPVLTADEEVLVFTSSRPTNIGAKRSKHDGHYTEDLYISYKTEAGWSEAKNIGTHINSEGNEATLAISADGQQMLVYHFADEGMLSNATGDIYITRLEGSEWTNLEKLPEQISSPKSYESGACFSADNKKIYFASDRDGGYGGNDIYVVEKLDDGTWGQPVNLGKDINTDKNEDSPFIHPDGVTLYFSSNGYKTMGGFDVFVSKMQGNDTTWSEPKNVGYPINTAHDDLHMSWSSDGRRVYFSNSASGGFGDKDLYYAVLSKEEQQGEGEAEPEHVMLLRGTISDSIQNKPVEAEIVIKDIDSDEIVGIFHSNSETGKYIIVLPENRHYSMKVEAKDYQLCDENLKIPDLQDFEMIEKDIRLCPKKK